MSITEALILTSTNPQYEDDRLFIELRVQYIYMLCKKIVLDVKTKTKKQHLLSLQFLCTEFVIQ